MRGRDFLSEILSRTRERVREAERRVPEGDLLVRAEALRVERRPFLSALSRPGMALIAEVKRASPSRGPIRADLDAAALARAYEAGGARCLSVLTEPHFFLGSAGDLHAARGATSLPVLRKDFTLTRYQVAETAALGADAVLLIVRAVPPEVLADLIEAASGLGLSALVEVHDEKELETALSAGARLIGINNRNLETFETRLETSERLAALLPPGVVAVAESGIRGPSDVARLAACGIRAFLVGESLVRSGDPEAAVRGLVGEGGVP